MNDPLPALDPVDHPEDAGGSAAAQAVKSDADVAAVLELLASRICHDLISPVGAINNGVEFMEEMGEGAGDEALHLISYSAAQAAAKLQAFRLVYGAGGKDPNIKPEDVQKAFAGLTRAEGKIAQMWDPYGPLGPKTLPKAYCKMLLGAMMLAAECLPKGGAVMVRAGDGDQTLVMAESPDCVLRPNVEAALNRELPPSDLDPRLVHPFALGVLAESYGYGLTVKDKTSDRITFTLNCPAAPAADWE